MTSVKNSDVYWLGKVASDWEIAPAWRVMKERGEKSLPDDVHLTPSQTHGVLTQQDYMDRTGNKVVLNLAGTDNMKRVRAGDFIIHLRSFQGGIEASAIDGKVSNAYTVLTPAPDAHFGYYRWFMKSVPLIEGLASSTDQLRDGQSINFSRFSRLSLPLPPFETQQRIADYLDRETAEIDAAVADLDRYVELLEKRIRVAISSIFAHGGKFVKLRHEAQFLSGFAFPSSSFSEDGSGPKLLRGINIKAGFISDADTAVLNKEPVSLSRFRLSENDLVLGMDRPFIGSGVRVAFVPAEFAGSYLVQRVLKIEGLTPLRTRLISYFLQSQQFVDYLTPDFTGISVPHLSETQVANFPVPWLDDAQVDKNVAMLDLKVSESQGMIQQCCELRESLLKRRAVLITEVVTGRKQV